MSRTDFRRLALAGTAALSLVVLAACGGDSDSPTASESTEDAWTPERAATMIVPSNAGGGSDLLGRAVAGGIEEVRDGVTVSVENRPGGSNAVGYGYLRQQDGDPLYLIASETAAISLPMTGEMPFAWTDFTPIAQVAEDVVLLAVRGDSPYQSLTDLVEAAEASELNLGVGGVGSPDDIVAELLQSATTPFNKVVFQGGAELLLNLLGGDVAAGALNPGEIVGQLEAGELRAIAVFTEERLDGELSDIPTAKEQGIDVSFSQFRGVLAAGNITDAERAFWEESISDWTETDSYQEYIDTNGLNSVIRVGDEFTSYLEEYESLLEQGLQ